MDIKKHDKICEAYWSIREAVREDPEYARMLEELETLKPRYEAALKKLPLKDQKLMEYYILLHESMGSRMLEWACGLAMTDTAGA